VARVIAAPAEVPRWFTMFFTCWVVAALDVRRS
jgi:hypothetical protein